MIRVLQYGLGPIGRECANEALKRDDLRLVGAVEIDAAKLGSDLADLLDLDEPTGIVVARSEDVLRVGEADVALLTTSSSLEAIRPQLEELIGAQVNVISSSEELFFPWFAATDIARAIDRRAREAGVVILGTGVNPGFVMDTLVAAVTTVCRRVSAVRAERTVDLGTRRFSLQRKLGVGLEPEEFRREAARLGHRGLPESVAFLAHVLGWPLDEIREDMEPVVAETEIEVGGRRVLRGEVAGISQTAAGIAEGRERVRLDLQMYVGATPVDRIRVDGDPPLRLDLEGGVPGDQATVASLLNAIPGVLDAEPGLRTMADLRLPRWRRTLDTSMEGGR